MAASLSLFLTRALSSQMCLPWLNILTCENLTRILIKLTVAHQMCETSLCGDGAVHYAMHRIMMWAF